MAATGDNFLFNQTPLGDDAFRQCTNDYLQYFFLKIKSARRKEEVAEKLWNSVVVRGYDETEKIPQVLLT